MMFGGHIHCSLYHVIIVLCVCSNLSHMLHSMVLLFVFLKIKYL